MKLPSVTKEKMWFILNSTFCFVSAFIVVKGVIALSRYVMMRHFSAWVHLYNFDLICMNGTNARIWTTTSVISMYSVGFLVALVGVFVTLFLYRQFKSTKGLLKLFFIWSYIISLNQSLGIVIRDIPIRRELYHALNWMYFPFELMIIITIVAAIILFIVNGYNAKKFLRLANSSSEIRDNKNRRITYTQVALLPSIIGSAFILLLHVTLIETYEIVELFLIILFISVPYILFIKSKIPTKIKIYKEEKSKVKNVPLIVMTCFLLFSFFLIKIIYF